MSNSGSDERSRLIDIGLSRRLLGFGAVPMAPLAGLVAGALLLTPSTYRTDDSATAVTAYAVIVLVAALVVWWNWSLRIEVDSHEVRVRRLGVRSVTWASVDRIVLTSVTFKECRIERTDGGTFALPPRSQWSWRPAERIADQLVAAAPDRVRGRSRTNRAAPGIGGSTAG